MREAGQARQIPLHSVTINKRWRSLVSSCISGWLSSRCFFLWLQVSLVLFAICKAVKVCVISMRLGLSITLLNVLLTIYKVRAS